MPVIDLQHAITLLETGKAAEAVRLLRQATDELPPYATARVLLARAHEDLDEWDRALAVWREAMHLIPNSPVVRRGIERAASRAFAAAPREQGISTAPDISGEPDIADEPPTASEPNIADEPPAASEPDIAAEPPAASEPDLRDVQGAGAETGQRDQIDAPHEPSSEPEPPSPTEPGYLDWLINEIDSARIVPRPDMEAVPPPELDDDIEDVVSETLARIYASQGQYDEAARVYELLAGQHPEDASDFMRKASEMRSRASDGE